MTHPQAPETWKRYKKGMCDGCWAGCCTMPVEMKFSDLVRLGLATTEEEQFDLDAVVDRLYKKRMIQTYQPRTGTFVLAQVAGRDCIFLDAKRRCSVYEKRPNTCREFPKVSSRPGFCPHSPIK